MASTRHGSTTPPSHARSRSLTPEWTSSIVFPLPHCATPALKPPGITPAPAAAPTRPRSSGGHLQDNHPGQQRSPIAVDGSEGKPRSNLSSAHGVGQPVPTAPPASTAQLEAARATALAMELAWRASEAAASASNAAAVQTRAGAEPNCSPMHSMLLTELEMSDLDSDDEACSAQPLPPTQHATKARQHWERSPCTYASDMAGLPPKSAPHHLLMAEVPLSPCSVDGDLSPCSVDGEADESAPQRSQALPPPEHMHMLLERSPVINSFAPANDPVSPPLSIPSSLPLLSSSPE